LDVLILVFFTTVLFTVEIIEKDEEIKFQIHFKNSNGTFFEKKSYTYSSNKNSESEISAFNSEIEYRLAKVGQAMKEEKETKKLLLNPKIEHHINV
ncbi:hypothetical protein TNCT_87121, partial [Trichonephila clavata]